MNPSAKKWMKASFIHSEDYLLNVKRIFWTFSPKSLAALFRHGKSNTTGFIYLLKWWLFASQTSLCSWPGFNEGPVSAFHQRQPAVSHTVSSTRLFETKSDDLWYSHQAVHTWWKSESVYYTTLCHFFCYACSCFQCHLRWKRDWKSQVFSKLDRCKNHFCIVMDPKQRRPGGSD